MDISRSVDYLHQIITEKEVDEVHVLPPETVLSDDIVNLCPLELGQLGIPGNILKILYSNLYHKTLAASAATQCADTSKWSLVLLLTNPNCLVFWNLRKKLCIQGVISLDEERLVSRLILKLHPKSSATFEHRRWLMTQLNMEDTLLSEELQLCTLTADRYYSNYYSWSHRLFCVTHHSSKQIWRAELDRMRKWREMNVSQYCVFSYCQYLLSQLGLQPDDLAYEYSDVCELIDLYPGHQSLWYHRKWIVYQLSKWKEERCVKMVDDELHNLRTSTDNLIVSHLKGLKILLRVS